MNAAPSPSGHQRDGIAPFGKNTKAVRKGAPEAVTPSGAPPGEATTPRVRSEPKVGRAMQAPRPRRKWRRFSAAMGSEAKRFMAMVYSVGAAFAGGAAEARAAG